jgi:glucose-1-phosphatase
MSDIRVLLFDLGGVLLRLNNQIDIFGLPMDSDEFLTRWIHSPAVREFERGAIDAESFAKAIVVESDLPYSWHEFLRRFEAWPDRLYPGTREMLDSIPLRYQRALLSNTNAIHWHRDGIADELAGRFNCVFLSYLTGQLKPDREAFQLVQDELNCEAGEIAFFDDNPANTEAAKKWGCQSFLTSGMKELRSSLEILGVLT